MKYRDVLAMRSQTGESSPSVQSPTKPRLKVRDVLKIQPRSEDPAPVVSPPASRPASSPGSRSFLSRPLGQEDNPNWVDAWAPFLIWLVDHYPNRLDGILAADNALCALEQSGIVDGDEYEAASAELFWRFEEARRLKMKESVKVWIQ